LVYDALEANAYKLLYGGGVGVGTLNNQETGYRKLPEILTKEEQEALLSIPNPKAPTGIRNLCMLRIMLEAGLRLSEVTGLKREDFDLESGELKVEGGKEKKRRTLWAGKESLELFKKWLQVSPESRYFFPTLKGGKLDNRYVREMVKRLAGKAHINKNISPHTLRHTFAAELYRKTSNIRLVQKALGHSSLSATMIYTYLVNDKIEDDLQFFRSRRAAA